MTEIYEVIKSSETTNEYDSFLLMLDNALEKIGSNRKSEKIHVDIGDPNKYIVKWIRSNETTCSNTGVQKYVWVNFQQFIKKYFLSHWGNFILTEEFYKKFFIPYLKNYYNINVDKEIKLESVSIEKLNLMSTLGNDYEDEYSEYTNKKKGTATCIVFKKLDSQNRGWITNVNLVDTILSFIRYYFQCKNATCKNIKYNNLELAKDGFAKMTCQSCSKSTFIEIKS